MRKHALPVYVALLLSIIIAAKLGYFPSHPAQSETKILNAEEFSQLWVKSRYL
jgi:ABC-type proline/glycine betaine transport system permease subunit